MRGYAVQLLAAPASDKSMLAVEEYLAGLSAAEVELEVRTQWSACLLHGAHRS